MSWFERLIMCMITLLMTGALTKGVTFLALNSDGKPYLEDLHSVPSLQQLCMALQQWRFSVVWNVCSWKINSAATWHGGRGVNPTVGSALSPLWPAVWQRAWTFTSVSKGHATSLMGLLWGLNEGCSSCQQTTLHDSCTCPQMFLKVKFVVF